jgi:phosphoglycerate dehydrogenase-like enzyme
MPRTAPRLHVHVQNDPESGPVFAVTPERFAAAARRHRALLRRIDVSYGEDPGAFHAQLRTAEVLVVGHLEPGALAGRAPRLRWIQSTNAGVEDVASHLPPGVVLTNASGVHGPKGAEFALTAMLMLNHAVPHFVTRQRERRWDQRFTSPIAGKTVVVVGVGRLGEAVARLARRFGLRVLGVRRSARRHPAVHAMFPPHRLHEALPRADFLVITTPLTPETRGLIGRRDLNLLPRHAGVVNLGRGAVLDEVALGEKLARGELGGAVLDVFDREPLPPESPLWATPNLIVTPHCAVDDGLAYVSRCLAIFFDNLRRYLAGRPLKNRVDASRGY